MASMQYGSLVEQVAVVTTAAGTTTLVNTSKQNQIFTGTAAQTIVLPSATTMSVGQNFNIFNQSTSPLTLQFNGGTSFSDASGASYSSVASRSSVEITLQTNGTAAGTWAVISSPIGGIGAPGPTIQKFLSGSGTYTTPTNVSFINVIMVGGGGGGGGSSNSSDNAGAGGTGGSTTFGTSLLVANGGGGGPADGAGGAGGTASLGSGPIGNVLTGGQGVATSLYQPASGTIEASSSSGGSSAFGGAGAGSGRTGAGNAGATNTGGGGAGGANPPTSGTNTWAGAGGGAGGYVNAIITNPSATYAYAVGAAGTAGTAGSGATAGGAGGSGLIIVTEYYFNGLGASAGNGGAYTPTVTTLTSGSGTFTTPTNASYISVQMVGGGGGGSGGGASAGIGGAGTNTTFGTSLLTAGGATAAASSFTGGVGGTNTITAGPIVVNNASGSYGSPGMDGSTGLSNGTSGGTGGTSPYGGVGRPIGNSSGVDGQNAIANSGSGGGGGYDGSATGASGGGGGSGGYLNVIIPSPASTYSYAVGTGGTGGLTGTSGSAGTNGGSGVIIVTTYYNNGAVGTATSITGSVNSSQVLGTTAVGSAPAGYIGEFISANPGSGVAVGSTGAFVTVTSVSLTAGDWDVEGTASLVTGVTTAGTILSGGISLNPTSEDSLTNGGVFNDFGALVASSTYLSPTGKRRINVSSTTTIYLVAAATYTVAGGATWGTNSFIGARRVR